MDDPNATISSSASSASSPSSSSTTSTAAAASTSASRRTTSASSTAEAATAEAAGEGQRDRAYTRKRFAECALIEIIHLHDCLRGALFQIETDVQTLVDSAAFIGQDIQEINNHHQHS